MRWCPGSWCVLLFLAAVASLWGADAALPGYFPSGARIVIGIRMRGLMDAFAAQGIGKEAQVALTNTVSQSPLGGIDVFRDLDEMWFASAGVGQNPPFLVVITGRFSEGAFSGGRRYRNALIVENKRNPQQVAALVDIGTVLAGDLSLVKAALDRGEAAEPIDPALAARVAALRGKYDIWGAGNPVPGPKLVAGEDPLSSMDRFDFGVAFTHGLECVADLHVRSPQDLDKLNSSLKILEVALKAQPANAGGGHFDLRTENSGIHVAISIPEEALKKAVATQRAAIASALAAQLGAAARTTTGAATSVSSGSTSSRPNPTGKVQVLKDARGDAVIVTLPGKE